jgi:hypothetical protein
MVGEHLYRSPAGFTSWSGHWAKAAAVERLRPCTNTVTMAVTNRYAEAVGYTHCQPRLPPGLPPSALPVGAPVSST